MSTDRGLRDKLTLLVSLLKRVLELRVQGIEAEILGAADFYHFIHAAWDVPRSARTSSGALTQSAARPTTYENARARHPLPALPPHLTFEVCGGRIAMLECRLDNKIARFRFYSRATGLRVLQMLVDQGGISASDHVALAARIKFYTLPESIEPVFEHGVTFGASFEDLRHVADGVVQAVMLLKGEPIKEQHEWIM